jgi:N utilization substance protein B
VDANSHFACCFNAMSAGSRWTKSSKSVVEESDATEDVWLFAEELARGAWSAHAELDKYITRYAAGWTLERMANADRNLLRLALYEILYREDIPQSVSINEAVELAKRYSTQESAKFINGILGSFAREKSKGQAE